MRTLSSGLLVTAGFSCPWLRVFGKGPCSLPDPASRPFPAEAEQNPFYERPPRRDERHRGLATLGRTPLEINLWARLWHSLVEVREAECPARSCRRAEAMVASPSATSSSTSRPLGLSSGAKFPPFRLFNRRNRRILRFLAFLRVVLEDTPLDGSGVRYRCSNLCPVNFLNLYDKLEKLVRRLPQSLQIPVLKEIRPLKTLFLHQRPPRVLLLGRSGGQPERGHQSAHRRPDGATHGGSFAGRNLAAFFLTSKGRLRVLDARRPATVSLARRSLVTEPPDVCLFLHSEPRREEEITADLEQAAAILQLLEEQTPAAKPSVLVPGHGRLRSEPRRKPGRHLDAALHQAPEIPRTPAGSSGSSARVSAPGSPPPWRPRLPTRRSWRSRGWRS